MPRISVVTIEADASAVACNADLRETDGEFVALLHPGDVLDPEAVPMVLGAIDAAAAAGKVVDFCYTDEARLQADGTERPWLKPDWSPERLRHQMYASRLAVMRRSVVLDVGGFRPGFEGAHLHDLVLRVTERTAGIIHVPTVLCRTSAPEETDGPSRRAAIRAVQEHLDRVGIDAQATPGATPSTVRITRVPDSTTSVSIVIPTNGKEDRVWGETRSLVTECVRSVLRHSAHESLEFIVVYDPPTPAATLDELRSIGDEYGVRMRLIAYREPFNFAAKCNVGACHATGDVLLFLNDDMEAVSNGIVETLIAPLREEGVGMTGAKLLFENGTIQHGGVVYGDGVIANAFHGAPGDEPGPHGDLTINRECSALTGACIAMKRTIFEYVGGFNEALAGSFNDVDLCHKVRILGLRLLWLHDVVLYHFESLSRDPRVNARELRELTTRWGSYKAQRDPFTPSAASTLVASVRNPTP